MYSKYPLFQSHLDLAHHYWEQLVKPGDSVIDATCGNGKDTLFLAKLTLQNSMEGIVYAHDIQTEAIKSAQHYLATNLSTQQMANIQFVLGCHSQFSSEVLPGTIKLIVYNLGYLPGGDKSKTTFHDTTLKSLQRATELIISGGAISITCYPGHQEGAVEEEEVLAFASKLPGKIWNCCHHRWINREKSPSLLLLQKSDYSAVTE